MGRSLASVAQLVRECIWRMETSGTFGSEVQVQDGHRHNSLGKELTCNRLSLWSVVSVKTSTVSA